MWRSKKVIIVAVLGALVLAGSIGGVVYAQTGNTPTSKALLAQTGNATSNNTILARVAKILGIDQQKVADAFVQAQNEAQAEALDNYLNNLVAQGKITRAQADQYKSWLQSRPDMTQYGQQLRDWQAARPGIPPELEAWQEARPDVPLLGGTGIPPQGGFGGHGPRGGMMRSGRPPF